VDSEKQYISIKNWAESDRPREKLLLHGSKTLSDAELIAILIRSGSKDESAVDVAKKILNLANNNLIELSKLSINDLKKFKGIGKTKAISIIAALELGKRRRESEVIERKKIITSKDVFEYFQSSLTDKQYEEFWILLLDRGNKIIKKISVSEGGISGTVVDQKKIFKLAVEHHASSIILCHNHPSGNIQPSKADSDLTAKLKQAGVLMDISIVDHLIIGDEKYFSFADEGMM
jgi:DNA repair protein RadC